MVGWCVVSIETLQTVPRVWHYIVSIGTEASCLTGVWSFQVFIETWSIDHLVTDK